MFETKREYWRRLDQAGKLYSATSNEKETRVFRFFCELKEEVQEDILQDALDLTIKKYPIFLSVMRNGLFWHYLERSSLRPVVREEEKEPCSNIYVKDQQNLLFEVTYYKKRINFEAYHAITDGTGATEFVKELVKNYLYLAHKDEGLEDVDLGGEDLTVEDQENDGFKKYYHPSDKKNNVKKQRAYQLRKPRKERGDLKITEASLSVQEMLAKAREAGVSITIYLAAAFICAIHMEMKKTEEKKPIVLMLPVNLRKFFPCSSMLNFFGWIEPGYEFDKMDGSFDSVLAHVKKTFEEELTKEKMGERMDRMTALEMHPILKLVPLGIKNPCINAGAKISEKDTTAIFSNMSVVKMPQDYVPYIERFGVFTNTPKLELCMCSFKDTISLGFTSRFDTTNIKRNFFKILADHGIHYEQVISEYPETSEEKEKIRTVFKGFSFGCLCLIVVSLMVNYMFHQYSRWSLYTAFGVVSMWIAMFLGYRKRHNLMKNAGWQMIIITCGAFLWDYFIGWKGWSVDFVFPVVCMLVEVFMICFSRIQKHSAREYMIYFTMASVYGLVLPLLFLFTKVAKTEELLVICAGFSFLFLASLPFFKGKEFKEEMQKKFHI